jgi:hypothetical protein
LVLHPSVSPPLIKIELRRQRLLDPRCDRIKIGLRKLDDGIALGMEILGDALGFRIEAE